MQKQNIEIAMILQQQIDDILDRIVMAYQPEKVFLIGSYASDNANENSDLDLLIIKNTNLPSYKRGLEISRLLKGVLIPIDILIYTPNEIEQFIDDKYSFLYQALKTSKLLYEHSGNSSKMVA